VKRLLAESTAAKHPGLSLAAVHFGLTELAPGVGVDEVRRKTAARVTVAERLGGDGELSSASKYYVHCGCNEMRGLSRLLWMNPGLYTRISTVVH
jgi:hypothetical protein